MLLPHGYEGQGPDHSSARLERFLQLCAGENIQVVNCTTPSNYFHVLRRQMHREFRKPLIIMTPKSLLRHKKCISKISEFSKKSTFHRILEDDAYSKANNLLELKKIDDEIKKVVMCSGKIYSTTNPTNNDRQPNNGIRQHKAATAALSERQADRFRGIDYRPGSAYATPQYRDGSD